MGPMVEVLNYRIDQSSVNSCKRELKFWAAHILIASSVGLYKLHYLLNLSIFCLKNQKLKPPPLIIC